MWVWFQNSFLDKIRSWLRAPVFDDLDKTRQAQNLNTILLAMLIVFMLYSIYPITSQEIGPAITAVAICAILITMLVLVRRGFVQLIGILFSTMILLAIVITMVTYGGVRNSGFATIILGVIIAYLTLGIRAGITYAGLSILAAVALGIVENLGLLPPYSDETTVTIVISHSLTLVIASLLLYLMIRNISDAMQTATTNERVQREAKNELEANRATLEAHAKILEREIISLQTIADVARISALILDEEVFLYRVVNLISERLGFKHTGIYILDDREEFAFLRAANDKAGEELISSQHSLPVITGEYLRELSVEIPWLNYQVGNNSYRIFKPIILTDILTNLSFPLIAKEHLIGLLNLQTGSPSPSEEELDTLQLLADQIAFSLENSRLVTQLQAQAKEINLVTGRTIQDTWRDVRDGQTLGFQYDRLKVIPASELFPAHITNRLRTGESIQYTQAGKNPSARLLAPIVVRGEAIGVIGYEEGPTHQWQQEEVALLETIASRVGLALENARLVVDAQRRAARERTIGEISAQIGAASEMDAILRTAVQELGRKLGSAEVIAELGSEINES